MGNRKFLNLFDAYGKLNKWTFAENGSVYFSAKFAGTEFYNTSLEINDIALYQIFDSTIPQMTVAQNLVALSHGMDNMNINIYNFTDGCVILSDTWKSYAIDCETLDTIKPVSPPFHNGVAYVNQMSSAHPIPEVGTTNHFTFLTSVSKFPGIKHKITLFRISSTNGRGKIAEFEVDKAPYMHSFSATKNFIILLSHPYYVDILKMLETGSPKESIQWHSDMPAVIYVVEIKTGKVYTLKTEAIFSMHHINAYESDSTKTKLVMDIASYTDTALVDQFERTIILNKTKRDSMQWQALLKRLVIDLSKNQVKTTTFQNDRKVPYASRFDIPSINENRRSVEYCYAYGLVYRSDSKIFSSFAYVKKDLCNSTGDRSWTIPGHYMMEGWFVPDPNGLDEDDGVILIPVLDGNQRRSYLAVLDARDLTLIAKSYTPIVVPFHFHGRFFPNVF